MQKILNFLWSLANKATGDARLSLMDAVMKFEKKFNKPCQSGVHNIGSSRGFRICYTDGRWRLLVYNGDLCVGEFDIQGPESVHELEILISSLTLRG